MNKLFVDLRPENAKFIMKMFAGVLSSFVLANRYSTK